MGKNTASNKEKDYLTNKLLSVFTIAFIMIFALMIVGRMMKRVDTFLIAWSVTRAVAVAFLILAIIGVGLAFYRKPRDVDMSYRLVSGKNVAVVSAFIALCAGALALVFNPSFLPILYVFIPTVAVTYIVYHSYQQEFFAVWLISGFGAVGIWIVGRALAGGYGHNHADLFLRIFAVLLALALIITVILHLLRGVVKLGATKQIRVFNERTHYGILYASYAVLISILTAVVLTGGSLTYQLIFALIGYIVLTGVYYTIKLI